MKPFPLALRRNMFGFRSKVTYLRFRLIRVSWTYRVKWRCLWIIWRNTSCLSEENDRTAAAIVQGVFNVYKTTWGSVLTVLCELNLKPVPLKGSTFRTSLSGLCSEITRKCVKFWLMSKWIYFPNVHVWPLVQLQHHLFFNSWSKVMQPVGGLF